MLRIDVRSSGNGLCLLSLLLVSACQRESPDGPRVNVSPIKGQVLVDGQPAANLAVRCVPLEGPNTALPTPSDFTDDQGRFEISTYESGDGAPPGEYQLIFQWGQYNLMNGQYQGDKLKGNYADPEKSEHVAVVVEGLPTDLGVIELTTEGDDDK
jgi:5-hydroxyisourate hydrolase-like protein (transthyretin family)